MTPLENFKKNLPPSRKNGRQKKKGPEPDKNRTLWLFLIPLGILILLQVFVFPGFEMKEMSYSEFYRLLLENPASGQILSCELVDGVIHGKLITGSYFRVHIPINDLEIVPLIRKSVPNFTVSPPQTFWKNLIYSVMPVLLLIGFFWFFVYRGMQQGGNRVFSFGKSRAKLAGKEKSPITFKDVAGVDEAKEELQEIIEFLKDPQRFTKLGGKIPKGVLLMGPPGTGKTLLAKAVAGEANVPFFSISGSDFVEMFVGVGAARVRDLFEQAKRAAKTGGKGAIIFVDEIDAVGRQRFAGIGGGHDEREQTLNALLVEMDGFDTHAGVILIASTNRPDVLDPALLRPGRFDRQVVVPLPDLAGREAILKVHAAKVKLAPVVDLKTIAKQTTYFSGADLANLVNEGALLAARLNKDEIGMTELQESIERVMAGPQRKSKKISEKERKIVAYHESGHAMVALLTPGADSVHKVTIIPRGMAGGYTVTLPEEDRTLQSRSFFLAEIPVALGGRVAEEIVFGDITTGAHNDLQKVTQIARQMVCRFGMSEKLGPMTFGKDNSMVFLGRDLMEERNYSEETARLIDNEVKRIIEEGYAKAQKILTENREKLELLAKMLLEKETLDADEIRKAVGIPAPPNSQSSEGGIPSA
ncbi:MAG: ATP-dependent zinc metalloprotease FtsH [Candidatus Omnitrophica bacterium ADurb.Bin277]|nr:MAG: ATP-dependent zinc metalloprotease FtsH [Candidatus Omnitrophica bacterium ADurb.Bin277]